MLEFSGVLTWSVSVDADAPLASAVAVGDFTNAKYPNNPSELPHKSFGYP